MPPTIAMSSTMPTANSRTLTAFVPSIDATARSSHVRQRLGVKHRVEHDFDRPRLEQSGARLGSDSGEANEQDAPVAGQQAKDRGPVCFPIQRWFVVGHAVCLEGVLSRICSSCWSSKAGQL